VLGRAPEQTVSAFRRCVRRAVLAAAPELAQIKHAQAAADRHVRRYPLDDGMAGFLATLTAVNAELVYLAVDAVARKMAAADRATAGGDRPGGDGLGMDARRADVLVGWALAALADPTLPKRHGRPVEVRLTTDVDSMLGLADHPAELQGYGFVCASVARALSADAKWRRFVTEPVSGHLLDCGTTVYRPPQVLIDYLVARDDTCRFPGCSMAAERCDIDHVCPHAKGGSTSACNCITLCRRHHLLKTFGGWLLECHGNGDVTWTAPTGQRFFVPANNHDPTIW
jgi:hypothetical protein